MISNLLNSTEYHSFYKGYIDKATDADIVKGMKLNLKSFVEFYNSIPEEKYDFAYAENKWTIKDILLHIIDTERILTYRALRIGRGDKTPLAGFEQDDYIPTANSKSRTWDSIMDEYIAVRNSTITLFENFESETLLNIGEASGVPFSVRALGYIISGHENHHKKIIEERYL